MPVLSGDKAFITYCAAIVYNYFEKSWGGTIPRECAKIPMSFWARHGASQKMKEQAKHQALPRRAAGFFSLPDASRGKPSGAASRGFCKSLSSIQFQVSIQIPSPMNSPWLTSLPLWWRRAARAVLSDERTGCRSARLAKCNDRSTVRNDVLSCDIVRYPTSSFAHS